MATSDETLKPCPFCGGDAIRYDGVTCTTECPAISCDFDNEDPDSCKVRPSVHAPTREESARIWNRRATSDEIRCSRPGCKVCRDNRRDARRSATEEGLKEGD